MLEYREILQRHPVDNLHRDDLHIIAEQFFESSFQESRYEAIRSLGFDTTIRCRYVRKTLGNQFSRKLLSNIIQNCVILDALIDNYCDRYVVQAAFCPEFQGKFMELRHAKKNVSTVRDFVSYSHELLLCVDQGLSVQFANLQYLLNKAIQSEDFESAAKLRDKMNA